MRACCFISLCYCCRVAISVICLFIMVQCVDLCYVIMSFPVILQVVVCGFVVLFVCFFWGELIDKYKDINANSKTVFTDYAMLK